MSMRILVTLALVPMACSVGSARAERVFADLMPETTRVTMAITKLEVTEKALDVHYEISNRTERDIWICQSLTGALPGGSSEFEVYVPGGSEVLVVRRRSLPSGKEWAVPPRPLYLRLLPGEQRSEFLHLALPIRPAPLLFFLPRSEEAQCARLLQIEIGFYGADFRERVFERLGEWAQLASRSGEELRDRDHTAEGGPYLTGEQVLTVVARLPRPVATEEQVRKGFTWPEPPDLGACTRLKIEYHPSMFDYFFPGVSEQRLFDDTERDGLRSQRVTVVADLERIASLARDVAGGKRGLFAGHASYVDVTCYESDGKSSRFTIFDDQKIMTSDGGHFTCLTPVASLRMLVPEIESYELRVQCGRNLKNLWYRFRLRGASKDTVDTASWDKRVIGYPTPAHWCDGMRETYPRSASEYATGRPYRCLGAGEGDSHYAMNPDCEPNSAGDMVLLFETKAGWNQHGGPELFTFDNHDPRGGCVLLNDGTVKFIRTEEELHALRWK